MQYGINFQSFVCNLIGKVDNANPILFDIFGNILLILCSTFHFVHSKISGASNDGNENDTEMVDSPRAAQNVIENDSRIQTSSVMTISFCLYLFSKFTQIIFFIFFRGHYHQHHLHLHHYRQENPKRRNRSTTSTKELKMRKSFR